MKFDIHQRRNISSIKLTFKDAFPTNQILVSHTTYLGNSTHRFVIIKKNCYSWKQNKIDLEYFHHGLCIELRKESKVKYSRAKKHARDVDRMI